MTSHSRNPFLNVNIPDARRRIRRVVIVGANVLNEANLLTVKDDNNAVT